MWYNVRKTTIVPFLTHTLPPGAVRRNTVFEAGFALWPRLLLERGFTVNRILVLEDDKDLNRVVCRHLNAHQFYAVGCLNAREAYDKMYS